MSLPSPWPPLSDQLQEAIRRRDPEATARLTRQWVHRHGLTSLESFCRATVAARQGAEAGDWLERQLARAVPAAPLPGTPSTAAPAGAGPGAGLEEAFAALEASFLAPPPVAGETLPDSAPAPDVRAVPKVHPFTAPAGHGHPAPSPSSLADLRAWLSDAPQHRVAG